MAPESPDEKRLIRAAARGDLRSFERLVVLKREQVVRIAYQITGDLEDARDVAQGVLVSLWKSLGRYDPARRFDTWLYRITVNAAIDHHRRRGPSGLVQPIPAGVEDRVRASGAGADRRVDRGELREIFATLAARLGEKQRAAFVLREVQGLETAEVARILDVTESTVRNHVLQARRTLRAAIESEYPELLSGRGGRR
jgi:RNA polymerase sigma-70 factor (ECF subfamily)